MLASFSQLILILSRTPIWVWLIFAYILYIGIKSTKKRTVYIPKIFIMPTVLMALKYNLFVSKNIFLPITYLTTLLVSSFVFFKFSKNEKYIFIKEQFSIVLPGNNNTLIILLLFFSLKYFFGFINATRINLYQQIQIIDFVLSALFSGYFLGKGMNYVYQFYHSN